MNKYQKQESREVKAMMKTSTDPHQFSYHQVRRMWRFMKLVSWCSPCEDCDSLCKGPYNKIAYCPNQR